MQAAAGQSWRARTLALAPVGARLAFNFLLARDAFPFGLVETRRIRHALKLDQTIQVPPASIRFIRAFQGRRGFSQIINFGPIGPIMPVSEHPTFAFIDEIIRLRKGYRETALYAAPRRLKRQIADGVRVRLDTDAAFEQYYDRCMSLCESIKRSGIIDLGDRLRSDGPDANMHVIVDDDGKFVHFTRGKHRLAIAQALGMETVPVSIYFVSGHCLRNQINPWQALSIHQVREAIDNAIQPSCRQ